MSHAYRLPIRVWHRKRIPYALQWRGVRYRVLHVNEPWVLADRWWVSAAEADRNGGNGYSDRLYYRVECQEAGAIDALWCDVYYDRAANIWIMDRVLD